MGKFFTTFENISIDEKGRISVPAHFRKAMSEKAENTFVLVRGVFGCLFAYPKDEWLTFWQGLRNLPITRENTLLIHRILGSLKESELDGQGRIPLTAKLREIAGLKRTVTIVGDGEKIQIWDPDAWKAHLEGSESSTSYDQDYFRAMQEVRTPANG